MISGKETEGDSSYWKVKEKLWCASTSTFLLGNLEFLFHIQNMYKTYTEYVEMKNCRKLYKEYRLAEELHDTTEIVQTWWRM